MINTPGTRPPLTTAYTTTGAYNHHHSGSGIGSSSSSTSTGITSISNGFSSTGSSSTLRSGSGAITSSSSGNNSTFVLPSASSSSSSNSSTIPPGSLPSSSAPSSSSSSTTTTTTTTFVGHASRPSMNDRSYSTSNIEFPVAANSIANRTATSAYGLYQQCLALRKQLQRVRGFKETFLVEGSACGSSSSLANDSSASAPASASSAALTPDETLLTSPISPTSSGPPPEASGPSTASALTSSSSDPVTQVCKCLRLGSSLCYLWNQLEHGSPINVNLECSPTNFKACQRSAAHFIMALTKQLEWDATEIFQVSELYTQDTSGTVKVISTVTRFLELLEERGKLVPKSQVEEDAESSAAALAQNALDPRARTVKEILESERKYVQDLEVLQTYQRFLQQNAILSQDTIHNLFLNLNSIVDFARRFLIGVEGNASLPPEQQRFGSLFVLMEEAFAVYEPYCVNFLAASDLAVSLATQENSPLNRAAHILEPKSELTMFHIKPVQRLTKYHLLMDNLIKATDSENPYYQEQVDGLETIKRITEKVNEETRKQENRHAVEDLRQRVEDWKGHELSHFGDLLLQDTFVVLKSDVERDYHVYLFQKIILCCKESSPPGGKNKVNKSNSMIRKSNSSIHGGSAGKKKSPLALKGRIFINNVIYAKAEVKPNSHLLHVVWRGDQAEEAFGIKCRTLEQLNQWHKAINRAVEAEAQRKSRVGHLSARRLASPHSQFPNTPQSELGPMLMGYGSYMSDTSHPTYNSSNASLASSLGASSAYAPSTPYGGTSFEDDGDEGYSGDYEPSTGRSTPSVGLSGGNSRRGPGTQSMPAGPRQDAAMHPTQHRPRAQTEDSNSAVIHQWRSQTPNGSHQQQHPAVPALPRSAASTSSGSTAHPGEYNSSSLRHSASKSALRNKQSHEWSNPMPQQQQGYSSAQPNRSLVQQMGDLSVNGESEPVRMLRQNSQGSVPPHVIAPPPLRTRSASSPNVYQLEPGQGTGGRDPHWSPYPVQDVHPSHFAGQKMANVQAQHYQQASKPRGMGGVANLSSATIASTTTTGSSTSNPGKRFSSSSSTTDRSSGDSAQSQGLAYMSPTSPSAPGGVHQQHAIYQSGTSSAIKVKLIYGQDKFLIVARDNITFQQLLDSVSHKLRHCGVRSAADTNPLKLRYQDEEGDKILMNADDDLAMAFDWLKQGGGGEQNTLIIFVD